MTADLPPPDHIADAGTMVSPPDPAAVQAVARALWKRAMRRGGSSYASLPTDVRAHYQANAFAAIDAYRAHLAAREGDAG